MTGWLKRWLGKPRRRAAQEALHTASQRVVEAQSREPEVNRLVASVVAAGERNHFIERLNMHVAREQG